MSTTPNHPSHQAAALGGPVLGFLRNVVHELTDHQPRSVAEFLRDHVDAYEVR